MLAKARAIRHLAEHAGRVRAVAANGSGQDAVQPGAGVDGPDYEHIAQVSRLEGRVIEADRVGKMSHPSLGVSIGDGRRVAP
jgi:hypothetical protein